VSGSGLSGTCANESLPIKICKGAHCWRVEVTNCVMIDECSGRKKRRLIDNFKTSMFNLKSWLQIVLILSNQIEIRVVTRTFPQGTFELTSTIPLS